MNPNDQNKFDRFAARVLRTSVLGMRKITGILKKPVFEIPAAPQRILVIKTLGLGSLVCASPALAAIRALYPAADITLLARRGLETLYNDANLYDQALIWEVHRLRDLPGKIREFRDKATSAKYDLAINLDSLSQLSSLLTLVSDAPATSGFVAQAGQTRGYTKPVVFPTDGHVTSAYLQIPAALGSTGQENRLVAPVLKVTELAHADETLRKWGEDETSYLIGINMNADETALDCAWPPEKFVLLAQAIEELGEYRTIFFGAGDEERFVGRHVREMDTQPINMAGRTSIRQFAALLTRLHLFITNDSGPLHLAAALKIPTVSVFCTSSPNRTGPPASESHAVVWHQTEGRTLLTATANDGGRGDNIPSLVAREEVGAYSCEDVRAVVADMLEYLADPDSPPWLEP